MTTATAKPFLFDTSFDEEELRRQADARQQAEEEARLEELRAEEEANPPPPTFSEEELQAAQAAAWQEGHAAGVADAQKEREAQITDLLENLTALVSGMHVHQDVTNEQIGLHLSKVAVAVMKHILPDWIEKQGAGEVKAVLGDCFERIPFDSKMIVTVSPETETLITDSIELLAARSGFEGRIRLVGDPEMGPSDLTAVWDGGGLERLESAIWQDIETRMARVAGQHAAPARSDAPATSDAPPTPQQSEAADPAPAPTAPDAAPQEVNDV